MGPRNVLPKRVGPDEASFGNLFVAGLARVAAKIGKGALADRMGRTTRSLDNILGGGSTTGKAMFDALLADETALDEVFAAYGYRLCPLHCEAANDLNVAAGVIDAMGELVKARADGHRDHNETLAVAALLRPHLPAMQAIVHEADELRGAA
ncbi:hypothetical protein [Sphingomonas beigongshangi]|uniref:hypothetical protein n=1 Tax=Sphingomonas beigongshangi TaxID=2782540 RepID=UPI00193B6182|nr:hypothetical protein [Sphingomonas beigongshangi]